VAGLATAETIHHLTRLFPAIRWPNDLLLNHRKVSGILVEAKSGAVIVGIGVNVTTRAEDLPETATSLAAAGGGTACEPAHLTGVLCRRFQTWYDVWMSQGFLPIREALRSWIGLFGQPIHISAGASQFEGTARDLDESGRLLVRLDSGIMRSFDMGEITLLT
jgi:BirA family biotin operon repressor/biotin-[acetyl-CoA-carboxylase] ligase